MNGQRSVLIVDRSEETREVLQTALERRGVRTLAAGRTEVGVKLAQQHHPDLIVLDVETDDSPSRLGVPSEFCPTTEMSTTEYQPRLVLLGNLRGWRHRTPPGEFVRKPYHYGPLIRRIEELLAVDTQSGSMGRADVVCHSRGRPGQPLRAERADDSAGARCV